MIFQEFRVLSSHFRHGAIFLKLGSFLAIWELENVFVKHYAPNHMPDPKENNSELHQGICSKVNQFIYTLVCKYMPNIRILAKAVLHVFCSQGCSKQNAGVRKTGVSQPKNLRNRFKS